VIRIESYEGVEARSHNKVTHQNMLGSSTGDETNKCI